MPSIYQRQDTWYLNYTVNGKRIRRPVGKSKKIAELALADLQLKIDRRQAGLSDPKITLDQFFEQSRARISRKNPGTRTRYTEIMDNFEKFIKSQRPPRFLADLTPDLFSAWASSETARGLHPATVNYQLDRLNSFFLVYVRSGQLVQSPIAAVERYAKKSKTPRWLTTDELQRLFQRITPRYKLYFITLLYTGLRRDELRYLQWSDIYNTTLYIRPKTEWSPKTRNSIRQIPIHPAVQDALNARRALAESDTWIFTAKSGRQLSQNILRNQLLRAARLAGIKNVTVHTFRHTFASHLVQQGVSIYLVSKLLGHSSVKQTEIYAHLAPAPDLNLLAQNLNFNL
jgi:integrase